MTNVHDALQEIDAMTCHLRQGGPDPMDLQELSDALERATQLANEALASLTDSPDREKVVLEFRSGDQTPDVKRGSMQCCIVVTENEQGKHFSFPGYYLNAYPLQYDECRCDEPCEDGCPTTGWFYDESNWEYEDCYHPIATKILRWAPVPDADAILSTIAIDPPASTANLMSIIADIREKTGVGGKPMLNELADAIAAEMDRRVADEREKCAKIADGIMYPDFDAASDLEKHAYDIRCSIAAAIRSQEAGR